MAWINQDGVYTLKTELIAAYWGCTNCLAGSGDDSSMDAARKAAHRHAEKTGHTVVAVNTRSHTYGRKP
jgi:hypothetical protein